MAISTTPTAAPNKSGWPTFDDVMDVIRKLPIPQNPYPQSAPGSSTPGGVQQGTDYMGILQTLLPYLFLGTQIGAEIYGAKTAGDAAIKAAEIQAASADKAAQLVRDSQKEANQLQKDIYSQSRKDMAPWLTTGRQALAALRDLTVGPPKPTARPTPPTLGNVGASPTPAPVVPATPAIPTQPRPVIQPAAPLPSPGPGMNPEQPPVSVSPTTPASPAAPSYTYDLQDASGKVIGRVTNNFDRDAFIAEMAKNGRSDLTPVLVPGQVINGRTVLGPADAKTLESSQMAPAVDAQPAPTAGAVAGPWAPPTGTGAGPVKMRLPDGSIQELPQQGASSINESLNQMLQAGAVPLDAQGNPLTVKQFNGGWVVGSDAQGYAPLNVLFGDGWYDGQWDALGKAGLIPSYDPGDPNTGRPPERPIPGPQQAAPGSPTGNTPTVPGAAGTPGIDTGFTFDDFSDPSNVDPADYGSLLKGFDEQFQFGLGDLAKDPGYQFRVQEGLKALDRSMAARGAGGGAPLKAAERYGQDFASQEFDNAYNRARGEYNTRADNFRINQADRFNRLSTIAGGGQVTAERLGTQGQTYATNSGNNSLNTALTLGNIGMDSAAVRASGYVANSNAKTTGVRNIADTLNDYLTLRNVGLR